MRQLLVLSVHDALGAFGLTAQVVAVDGGVDFAEPTLRQLARVGRREQDRLRRGQGRPESGGMAMVDACSRGSAVRWMVRMWLRGKS